MRKKIVIGLISILTASVLLFSGCGRAGNKSKVSKENTSTVQTAGTSGGSSAAVISKDPKKVTDNDLLNLSKDDETGQLDSLDEGTQVSSDDVDTLLNDNSELNSIPTNVGAN